MLLVVLAQAGRHHRCPATATAAVKKIFLDGHTPGLAPATTTASVKIAVPFGTPAGQVSGKIDCFRYRGVI